jgi:hypothetical protein
MGRRWNSHCGIEERRITRQISGGWGWGWIFSRGFLGGMIKRIEERGNRLNFWAPTKVLKNPPSNVFQKG